MKSVPVLCNQVLHTSIKKQCLTSLAKLCPYRNNKKKTLYFWGEYLSNYTIITMFSFFSFFTYDFYRVLWLLRPLLIDKENNYVIQLGPPTFFAPNDSSTRGQLYGNRWVHLTKGASHSAHTLASNWSLFCNTSRNVEVSNIKRLGLYFFFL